MSVKYEDTNYNLACNLSPVMSQFLELLLCIAKISVLELNHGS